MAASTKKKHARYINPATDFGFKTIFKDEEITREFLNDLLHTRHPEVNIAKVSITDGEYDESESEIRRVVYDVHCTTDTGEEFVIEMQNDPQEYFSDRIVLYMARITSRKQHKGMQKAVDGDGNITEMPWNYHMPNIYGVFFMNYIDKNRPKAFSHCALMDTKSKDIDSEVFQYWKIQMPFYKNRSQKTCKRIIDKWFYILANLPIMNTALPFTKEKPIFMKLAQIAEYSNLNARQQRQYDESLDNYLVYINAMDYREKTGYEKGVDKGREEGRAEGMAQGMAQQLLENVRNLISAGFDFNKVVEMLKIPAEKIDELREMLSK